MVEKILDNILIVMVNLQGSFHIFFLKKRPVNFSIPVARTLSILTANKQN